MGGAEKPYCAALQDDPPVYYSYANTRDSPSRSRLMKKKKKKKGKRYCMHVVQSIMVICGYRPGLLVHDSYGWKLRAILSHTCVSLATRRRHKAVIMLATNLLKRVISQLCHANTHAHSHAHSVNNASRRVFPWQTVQEIQCITRRVVTWDNVVFRTSSGCRKKSMFQCKSSKNKYGWSQLHEMGDPAADSICTTC